ncbi:MAG: type II toxin-antitoxin system RelE/ParE family toxin [Halobacteria archaeon]
MSDEDEWTWRLSSTARSDFQNLEPNDREQIETKLDEICDSPWREPPEYGEPLEGSPFRKVRIGGFRLSVTFVHDEKEMVVARIKRRGGAYTADD